MDSVVFDTSLPEKILFLKSISSDILSPSDARKYFNDLQFIENCPVLWCKIEPLIVAWETEIARCYKEICDITYEDICLKNVKNEIESLKLTFNDNKKDLTAPNDEINVSTLTVDNKTDENLYLEESLIINDNNVNIQTNLDESQNLQEPTKFENEIVSDNDSILGKRILVEENITIEENKLTKIE